MAYATGSASSMAMLMDNLQDFLSANGWQIITKDSKMPPFSKVTSSYVANPYLDNSYALLCANKYTSIGYAGGSTDFNPAGTRLVVREPNNGVYWHIFGFDARDGFADGADTTNLTFLEVWLSDGWSGSSADVYNHPNILKMVCGGPYRANTPSYHFFAGANPHNGRYYVNLVIETMAESYEHFTFGAIDTYIDLPACEIVQASGQSAGSSKQTVYSYSPIVNNSSIVTNLFGEVTSQSNVSSFIMDMTSEFYPVSRQANNNARLNSVMVRHSQFGKSNSRAINLGFKTNPYPAAPASTSTEILLQPYLFGCIPVYNLTPNSFSGVSVFAPMYCGIYSPLEAGYCTQPFGQYPNQRYINIANNAPGDVIAYGEDEWVVFPLNRKGDTTYNGTYPVVSGNHGVAYKK